ncbi:MAG: prepilin-type N-terminal cleavage/methylation domain-containing protein [Acetobacterium sp.]|nr:prepilin-type N-terminal cleavage/methylation domain-containing protein [Bacillota bacterium]MCG2729250.1 prepilin-type N-terminal cleavage/methylation domain-containing protein [Acetobacterium sp.]
MGNKSKSVKQLNNVSGFTLMEIIVVIAILGALAALAIPQFTGVLENAQKKTDLANIRIVESAIELYQAEIGKIPASVDSFNELITELNRVGYIKSTELLAVSKGKSFSYDAVTNKITLIDAVK